MLVKLFGKLIEVKEEQALNALPPMLVKLFGKLIEVKEGQL